MSFVTYNCLQRFNVTLFFIGFIIAIRFVSTRLAICIFLTFVGSLIRFLKICLSNTKILFA